MIFPLAVVALVITGTAGLDTVKVRVAWPVPPALLAPSVTLETPFVVGVPEINPELVAIPNPGGSPDALKLVGEALAAMV